MAIFVILVGLVKLNLFFYWSFCRLVILYFKTLQYMLKILPLSYLNCAVNLRDFYAEIIRYKA